MERTTRADGLTVVPSDAVADAHELTVAAVTERLATDRRAGLHPDEAVRRLAEYGPNELAPSEPSSCFMRPCREAKTFFSRARRGRFWTSITAHIRL